MIGTTLTLLPAIGGYITGLADEFKRVHVVCVPGNHGRLTRKPRAKFYARNNLDWLVYNLLERELRSDPRITWCIPESRDAQATVYSTRIRVTHGDEAKGGSGISAEQTPLALLEHRKNRRVIQAHQEPFDVMMYHHWHKYEPGGAALRQRIAQGYRRILARPRVR